MKKFYNLGASIVPLDKMATRPKEDNVKHLQTESYQLK